MTGFFEWFIALLVILWWLVKVVAFVIFLFALFAVVGALFNNTPPAGSDIAWLIISIIGMIVL